MARDGVGRDIENKLLSTISSHITPTLGEPVAGNLYVVALDRSVRKHRPTNLSLPAPSSRRMA